MIWKWLTLSPGRVPSFLNCSSTSARGWIDLEFFNSARKIGAPIGGAVFSISMMQSDRDEKNQWPFYFDFDFIFCPAAQLSRSPSVRSLSLAATAREK